MAEVAEAPRWESGWRVLCPERRASERKWGKRRVSERGRRCRLKEGGTLSRAPHVGLRVAFAEAERYIKVCSRKDKRKKFQQLIDRGTLVVGKAQGRRSNC